MVDHSGVYFCPARNSQRWRFYCLWWLPPRWLYPKAVEILFLWKMPNVSGDCKTATNDSESVNTVPSITVMHHVEHLTTLASLFLICVMQVSTVSCLVWAVRDSNAIPTSFYEIHSYRWGNGKYLSMSATCGLFSKCEWNLSFLRFKHLAG